MNEIVESRIKEGAPNPEEEKLDLNRLDEEAKDLIMLAQQLVAKVQEDHKAMQQQLQSGPPDPPQEDGSLPAITIDDTTKGRHKTLELQIRSVGVVQAQVEWEGRGRRGEGWGMI